MKPTKPAASACRPSKVWTAWPAARAASMEQERTGLPSTRTVHRPQPEVSHPRLTLGHPWARRKSISRQSGSIWAVRGLPFKVSLISIIR